MCGCQSQQQKRIYKAYPAKRRPCRNPYHLQSGAQTGLAQCSGHIKSANQVEAGPARNSVQGIGDWPGNADTATEELEVRTERSVDGLVGKALQIQECARLFPDRKSTRLNSSHVRISYAVFCLKKKKKKY